MSKNIIYLTCYILFVIIPNVGAFVPSLIESKKENFYASDYISLVNWLILVSVIASASMLIANNNSKSYSRLWNIISIISLVILALYWYVVSSLSNISF